MTKDLLLSRYNTVLDSICRSWMIKAQWLSSSSWLCQSCRSKVFSTNHRRSASTAIGSKPANQRLSRDVAKNNLKPSRTGPKSFSPPKGPLRRPVGKRDARPSQGRMSKTGISVLSDVPIHERAASKSRVRGTVGFENIRVLPAISNAIASGALRGLEYITPTAIQALAIPAILKNERRPELGSYLVAAETGSGKTLAYLTPILQALKNQELEGQIERQVGHPRCVILLPSTELVKQVGALVKTLSYGVKLSSAKLMPVYKFRRSKNQVLKGPLDILVTLPHQLSALVEEGLLHLDKTRHLVIDEADTLLESSFRDTVSDLIEKSSNLRNLIFCTATIPRSVDSSLRKQYPDLIRLVSPKVHSIPRRIITKFVDVDKDYKGNKNIAAHQILRDLRDDPSEPGKGKRVILFVNKRESIAEVTEYLQSKDIDALPFSRDDENRAGNLSHFLAPKDRVDEDRVDEDRVEEDRVEEPSTEGLKVLITTDLASRGVDTTPVKNVIIYDTPHSTIDLLHRIGRTGRAGRRGTAYILLGNKRGEAWIRDVKHLSVSGQPLV